MNSFFKAVFAFVSGIVRSALSLWRRYRSLRGRSQIALAVVAVIIIGGGFFMLKGSGSVADALSNTRTVTLATVGALSGESTGTSILGTVRSLTEAELFAQAGGAVTSVHTKVGASVPAGFVIAELDAASEAASVLQAQGVYESALAGAAGASPTEVKQAAVNIYRSAFTTLDTDLKFYADTVFGAPTANGPELLINSYDVDSIVLSHRRTEIDNKMSDWRATLADVENRDPSALLAEANNTTELVLSFLNDLGNAANTRNSGASSAQISALASARASVNALGATITTGIQTYNTQSSASNAGTQASVKQALGTLRLAQAAYEKKIIRAPIAGTVNFLAIRQGDYVSALQHVATVAQNGALEVAAEVTEENSSALAVGTKVTVDDKYPGVVTSIAPALDPVTKQIEVLIAVSGTNNLVNGQSVRITLPATATAVQTATSTGPVLLPLASVKLTATNRVVFTVDENNRLVAVPVTIGDVRGDRIEITSPLPTATNIVTDARGLSEGERVSVAVPPAL